MTDLASQPDPTWFDDFVKRIPNAEQRADFLKYWIRLKRGNENDELLQLVTFMSVLTAIMQDIPQEALRLAKELPKDPVIDRLESTRAGWNKLFEEMREPELAKRLDTLKKTVGHLERLGKTMELRLTIAIALPAFLAGVGFCWILLHFYSHTL